LNGGRLPTLALLAGGVVSLVDQCAQFLRAIAGRCDRPSRE
jgi:hypothetical protein